MFLIFFTRLGAVKDIIIHPSALECVIYKALQYFSAVATSKIHETTKLSYITMSPIFEGEFSKFSWLGAVKDIILEKNAFNTIFFS